ncbi:MAG: 23S rRNA (adenine(2503)-C(2))-methyltransferase RlmN [Planctomycetes bacterium]|nr:23S rRNA (adenine(2503)-C(2))-methyltransferase RlmN [Planctomycetota bacterium]
MTGDAARRYMELAGHRAFRGSQAVTAVWKNHVRDLAGVTTFPKSMRQALSGVLAVSPLFLRQERLSVDGTAKYLFACPDGETIESVRIPSADGRVTGCVSSQTGCPLGCVFCATGLSGPGRNLSPAEIAGQVFELLAAGGPLTNIVFMGMGEPLLNLDAVLDAFRVIHDGACAGIGRRRVTLSTVGIPAGLEKLRLSGEALRLAVSLHSAVAETRKRLVPGVAAAPSEIVSAAMAYGRTSRLRVTFECVLMDSLNDDRFHAQALASMLEHADTRVNLIPYNPVSGSPFRSPPADRVRAFRDALAARGVKATIRVGFGADIEAACGQLRSRSG